MDQGFCPEDHLNKLSILNSIKTDVLNSTCEVTFETKSCWTIYTVSTKLVS